MSLADDRFEISHRNHVQQLWGSGPFRDRNCYEFDLIKPLSYIIMNAERDFGRESPIGASDDVSVLVECADCGTLVPEANLQLHQLRACGSRKPAALEEHSDSEDSSVQLLSSSHRTSVARRRNVQETEDDGFLFTEGASTPPPAVAAATSQAESNTASLRASSNENFVDMAAHDDDDESDCWTCSKCTLINPLSATSCQACDNRNPDCPRPPDTTHRMRLVDDDGSNNMVPRYISNGALLGGMLGAAGAYMTGSPSMTRGALSGAVQGAVGGAVVGSMMGSSPSRGNSESQMGSRSGARFSGTVLRSGPDGIHFEQLRQRPTREETRDEALERVHTQLNALLAGDSAYDRRRTVRFGGTDIAGLLRNHHTAQHLDSMGYEQLLQAFGDGSENRGADATSISRLPTSIVDDPSKLGDDYGTCVICLEEFQAGDVRKTLPCLHGFHEKCVDNWLAENACCPCCKHRIERD